MNTEKDDIIRELALDLSNQPRAFKRDESLSQRAARNFDYNDPELLFRMSPNGPVVMGGSKEKLMLLLTNVSLIEFRYINEFLSVYPYFASTNDLIESLWSAYYETSIPQAVSGDDRAEYIQKVRKRVLLILRRWMDKYPSHFRSQNEVPKLAAFIDQIGACEEKEKLELLLKVVILISL